MFPPFMNNNVEDLWSYRNRKLYNRSMVAAQRPEIRTAKLQEIQPIAELADRINRHRIGLKEFRIEEEGEEGLILASS